MLAGNIFQCPALFVEKALVFAFEGAHIFAEMLSLGFTLAYAFRVLLDLLIALMNISLETRDVVLSELMLLFQVRDAALTFLNNMVEVLYLYMIPLYCVLELKENW